MLNIKFLSIIWKLTNSLSVTVGERGKSASHVFCIRVTMLLTDILSGFPLVVNQMIRLLFTLEIPVYTPFRYDEGSQTHTQRWKTQNG